MKRFLFGLLLLGFKMAQGQYSTKVRIDTSHFVHDEFEIYTSLPPKFDSSKVYKTVYYLDANLKSGKELRELLLQPANSQQVASTIFIGIGHTGNYHQQRRRDFIPADTLLPNSNAAVFYNYLRLELIPETQSLYPVYRDSNSIIGHSFGGLFVFYCLFQNDNLFSSFYALSPSLWVDNYAIYKQNKSLNGFAKNQYLYFVAGSKETLNRILTGTSKMNEFLIEQHYPNLSFEYDVIKGKTHNSEVPFSLQTILSKKLK